MSPHIPYIQHPGAGILHVVDASAPGNLTRLLSVEVAGVDLTDIELCGGVVYVTHANLTDPSVGHLAVYSLYDPVTRNMELIRQVEGDLFLYLQVH